MLLRFTKMHGLGNDFMVLDLVSQHAHILPKHAKQWGDRHTGIGFDQLLLVEAPSNPDVDFPLPHLQFRRLRSGTVRQRRALLRPLRAGQAPDGQEDHSCGNQGRHHHPGTFAAMARSASTWARRACCRPIFRSRLTSRRTATRCRSMARASRSPRCPWATPMRCCAWTTSTTHRCTRWGRRSNIIRAFRHGVNVGFLHVVDRTRAQLRVWERGAGETQACGTGACAAAVAAISQGWMDSPLLLDLPGGRLSIEWAGPGHSVIMTGPAVRVFEGQVRL